MRIRLDFMINKLKFDNWGSYFLRVFVILFICSCTSKPVSPGLADPNTRPAVMEVDSALLKFFMEEKWDSILQYRKGPPSDFANGVKSIAYLNKGDTLSAKNLIENFSEIYYLTDKTGLIEIKQWPVNTRPWLVFAAIKYLDKGNMLLYTSKDYGLTIEASLEDTSGVVFQVEGMIQKIEKELIERSGKTVIFHEDLEFIKRCSRKFPYWKRAKYCEFLFRLDLAEHDQLPEIDSLILSGAYNWKAGNFVIDKLNHCGQEKRALDIYPHIKSLDPEFCLYNLGYSFYLDGNYQYAERMFEIALKDWNKYNYLERGKILNGYVISCVKSGKSDAAEKAIKDHMKFPDYGIISAVYRINFRNFLMDMPVSWTIE